MGSLSGPKGIPKRRQKGAKRRFYLEPGIGDHLVSFVDLFVSIVGGFREDFERILGRFWEHFGSMLPLALLLVCFWFSYLLSSCLARGLLVACLCFLRLHDFILGPFSGCVLVRPSRAFRFGLAPPGDQF